MYQLICTSYGKTEHGFVLRSNWIEENVNDDRLLELIEKWKLPNDFRYPSKESISDILVGELDVPNVIVNVRIIRFN